MTDLCGAPHHDYPQTLCTEPPGHYILDRDPHAGPLIIDGRECGGAAWDEPKDTTMTDRPDLHDRLIDVFKDADVALSAEQRGPLADMALDALSSELATLDRYENTIAWHTTCTSCARILDSSIQETERAERAEAVLNRVRALHESWVHAGPPPLGVSMARWWDKRLVELRAALQADGQQSAPSEPVDWQGVLRGFQALLDAFPADLHPGGPAVSCRPQPAQLVARWRDTVHAARAQLAADRCCGKPPGATCAHDIAPSVNQTTEN